MFKFLDKLVCEGRRGSQGAKPLDHLELFTLEKRLFTQALKVYPTFLLLMKFKSTA